MQIKSAALKSRGIESQHPEHGLPQGGVVVRERGEPKEVHCVPDHPRVGLKVRERVGLGTRDVGQKEIHRCSIVGEAGGNVCVCMFVV